MNVWAQIDEYKQKHERAFAETKAAIKQLGGRS